MAGGPLVVSREEHCAQHFQDSDNVVVKSDSRVSSLGGRLSAESWKLSVRKRLLTASYRVEVALGSDPAPIRQAGVDRDAEGMIEFGGIAPVCP